MMATSTGADGEPVLALERALFQESGVWFYQVPAGQVSSLSPRADSWEPEHPLLTGALLVLQRGDACVIKLFEPAAEAAEGDDGRPARTLFAQCPLEITRELPLDVYVQDCVDSSRYFMIRVEDEATQRRAYVGIGFPERASAFNFKATLQDYAKYALRQAEVVALEAAGDEAAEGKSSPLAKTQDLSLPQGTTIRINLKGVTDQESGERSLRRRGSSGSVGEASPGKVPLIPPPPSGVVARAAQPVATPSAAPAVTDEDDWGDFTSA